MKAQDFNALLEHIKSQLLDKTPVMVLPRRAYQFNSATDRFGNACGLGFQLSVAGFLKVDAFDLLNYDAKKRAFTDSKTTASGGYSLTAKQTDKLINLLDSFKKD